MKTAKKQTVGSFTLSKKSKELIEKMVDVAIAKAKLSRGEQAFVTTLARLETIKKKRTPNKEDLAFLDMLEETRSKK